MRVYATMHRAAGEYEEESSAGPGDFVCVGAKCEDSAVLSGVVSNVYDLPSGLCAGCVQAAERATEESAVEEVSGDYCMFGECLFERLEREEWEMGGE